MTFDAQCDVASIVYGVGDDPDRLLIEFANDLARSGFRPVGVAQRGHNCHSTSPGLGVVTLPNGNVISLVDDRTRDIAACRLENERLEDLAKQLTASIEGGADLIIVNRFGHSEAEGRGLVDLISQALNADIPLLIAVSERRFPTWIRFCNGMSVRLACRRDMLDRWWRSISVNEKKAAIY